MRKWIYVLMLVTSSWILGACSSSYSDLDDYTGTRPVLKLEEFFDGPLVAHGMLQDRSGKVTRRFSVDLVGRWEGNKGVLEEDFVYDDGEKQRRVWRLEKLGEGRYRGEADDVVEPALGTVEGFAFNWRYTLTVPYKDGTIDVKLNDWMYLLDEQRLINRADMTKFGFKVGEITLWIERISAPSPAR